jgi:hypothetical protein
MRCHFHFDAAFWSTAEDIFCRDGPSHALASLRTEGKLSAGEELLEPAFLNLIDAPTLGSFNGKSIGNLSSNKQINAIREGTQ